MTNPYTEEELLDLIDALDAKIDEIDEQIVEAKASMPAIEDEIKRERKAADILALQRERVRINTIITGHMKTLKEIG
jgi:hypothetical protein